jgi:uncharacterized ferredoxin-like protein
MQMDVMETVAQMMALSARTAPKAGGKDYLELKVIQGEDLAKMAQVMIDYGVKTGKKNFDRDGNNVRNSAAVLLVALKDAVPVAMDCGACGFAKCAELPKPKEGPEFDGPWCAWRMMDLGIALGSAVKTASILNADNRIMYRLGVVARQLRMIEGQVVVGIPIAATGKSIYFDR